MKPSTFPLFFFFFLNYCYFGNFQSLCEYTILTASKSSRKNPNSENEKVHHKLYYTSEALKAREANEQGKFCFVVLTVTTPVFLGLLPLINTDLLHHLKLFIQLGCEY